MGRIPTIIAESSLPGGPTGPEASALAFSGGAGGLEAMGQGLSNAGATLAQIALKQKRDDEVRWYQNASAQYQEQAINFLHDPANSNREDYADIAKKFLKEQQAAYLEKSPSTRATQLFNGFANHFYGTNLDNIIARTNAVKLENTRNDVETNVQKAMGAFRGNPDNVTAEANAETLRGIYLDGIKQTFGGIAPTAERKLKEYIDEQFVFGVAEKSPDYARRILNQSENISEDARKRLGDMVDHVENRVNRVAQYEFGKTLDRAIDFGFSNDKLISPVPKAAFIGLHGKDDGELLFRKFEDQRIEANTAIAAIGQMKDKNAASITKQVNEFGKAANVSHAVKNLVEQRATELVRMQTKDASGYLAANNDETHSAFTAFQAATTPDEQRRTFQKFADTTLHFQGFAPEGAKDPERYLGLATHLQHVMPLPMAQDWASQLNKGSYDEKLKTLQRFGGLFESYDAWKVGFDDLVTVPPEGHGIKPQYQLALQFLNWKDGQAYFSNPELVRNYLAAQDNNELLKEIGKNKEKYTDYSEQLMANPNWQSWASSHYGENWQRASDVHAIKDGLIAYAWANGKNANEGVRDAVDTFITKRNYIGSINGQPFPMSKTRKDGSTRTDAELEDIVRRLAVSPKYLDVDKLDKSRLYFVPFELGDNSPETRLHTLRYIMSEGFFHPDKDGNAATLYVMSDNNIPTQLTDKKGKPFRIHLDNMPDYLRSKPFAGLPADAGLTGDMAAEHLVPEKPSKSFSSDEFAMPTWAPDEMTNWPVRQWTIKASEWQTFRDVFHEMMRLKGESMIQGSPFSPGDFKK